MRHKLSFVATGDRYNGYRAVLNGIDIDGCDINSEQYYTQAHIIIRSVWDTLKTRDIDIEFDDTRAIHHRKYTIEKLVEMAEFAHLTGQCRIYL